MSVTRTLLKSCRQSLGYVRLWFRRSGLTALASRCPWPQFFSTVSGFTAPLPRLTALYVLFIHIIIMMLQRDFWLMACHRGRNPWHKPGTACNTYQKARPNEMYSISFMLVLSHIHESDPFEMDMKLSLEEKRFMAKIVFCSYFSSPKMQEKFWWPVSEWECSP